jgi:hypothetical protein
MCYKPQTSSRATDASEPIRRDAVEKAERSLNTRRPHLSTTSKRPGAHALDVQFRSGVPRAAKKPALKISRVCERAHFSAEPAKRRAVVPLIRRKYRSSSSIEIALISQGYRKARSLRQPVDTMRVGSPLRTERATRALNGEHQSWSAHN